MPGLILCSGCSNNLGEVQLFYDTVYKGFEADSIKKNPKIRNYHPSKIRSTPGLIPSVKFLLDALELKNICCRTRIMSIEKNHVDYK